MGWVGEPHAGDFFLLLANHTLPLLSSPAGLFCFTLPEGNACIWLADFVIVTDTKT